MISFRSFAHLDAHASTAQTEFEPFCVGRRAELELGDGPAPTDFEPIQIVLSTGDGQLEQSGASSGAEEEEAAAGAPCAVGAADAKGGFETSLKDPAAPPMTPRSMAQRIALRRQASFERRRASSSVAAAAPMAAPVGIAATVL